jgi:type II secretory pathway pseudopilin PulG
MLSKTLQSGFTTPELLMVIVVIALLCIAAIPQFFSMQNARRETEMQKVVAVVQAGITREQARNIAANGDKSFPATLDEQPTSKPCQICFNKILAKPVDLPEWYKVSNTEYLFSRNGNHAELADYQENGDYRISYDQTTGFLSAQQIVK